MDKRITLEMQRTQMGAALQMEAYIKANETGRRGLQDREEAREYMRLIVRTWKEVSSEERKKKIEIAKTNEETDKESGKDVGREDGIEEMEVEKEQEKEKAQTNGTKKKAEEEAGTKGKRRKGKEADRKKESENEEWEREIEKEKEEQMKRKQEQEEQENMEIWRQYEAQAEESMEEDTREPRKEQYQASTQEENTTETTEKKEGGKGKNQYLVKNWKEKSRAEQKKETKEIAGFRKSTEERGAEDILVYEWWKGGRVYRHEIERGILKNRLKLLKTWARMNQELVEKRKRGLENKENPEKQGKQTIRTNKEKCYICSMAMEIGTVGWKIEARNNKKGGSFSYQRGLA